MLQCRNLIPFVVLSTALAGCPSGPGGDGGPPPILAAGPDRAPDPEATGPYAVGVTTGVVEDATRLGLDGSPRRLRVEIWYPADEAARGGPRDVYDLVADAPPEAASSLEGVVLPTLEQPAVRDAPIREDQGLFPLVVFSHGSGGVRAQSFTYTAHLASHGYVVASPDHPGNTMYDLVINPNFNGAMAASAMDRPQDVSVVIDAFESGTLTGDRVEPWVDLERIGVTGHSFGGLTSLFVTNPQAEFYDRRIDVSFPITPATEVLGLAGAPVSGVEVPVFYLGATADQTLDYQAETVAAYEQHAPPKGMAGVVAAGHFSFSEICSLDLATLAVQLEMEAGVAQLLEDGCGPQNIDVERAHALNNLYGAAWMNVWLRDSQGTLEAWLDPADAPEDVEYRLALP